MLPVISPSFPAFYLWGAVYFQRQPVRQSGWERLQKAFRSPSTPGRDLRQKSVRRPSNNNSPVRDFEMLIAVFQNSL